MKKIHWTPSVCHERKVKVSLTRISFWPHGLQPARLLCPWNFPGKNTGVGCPSLQGSSWPREPILISCTAGRYVAINGSPFPFFISSTFFFLCPPLPPPLLSHHLHFTHRSGWSSAPSPLSFLPCFAVETQEPSPMPHCNPRFPFTIHWNLSF